MIPLVKSFLVALEEGSLNRAAARLRMSQPALTRQVQALEREIGGPLLERLPTGVRPTELGHALAAGMKPVLASYESALQGVRQIARGARLELRVGYLGSAAPRYLTPALGWLRRERPDIKVVLRDLTPGEQIAALREGSLDVAMIGQEGVSFASEFYTRKLASLGAQALLPDDHPLAAREALSLSELSGEVFIGAPESEVPGRNAWVEKLCRKSGFSPRFLRVGESIGDVFSLVASEGAVAVVPGYFPSEPAPGAVARPISDAFARWDFLVMWQRGRGSPARKALLRALAENVPGARTAR